MSKNDSATVKTIKFLLPSLIAFMLCVLGMYEFLPCVIASAVFTVGFASAAIASITMVAGTWAMFGEATGVYALLLWLVALNMVMMLRLRKPYRTTLVISAIIISFAILLFVLMKSKEAGVKPFEDIINSVVALYLALGYIPPYQEIYDLGLMFLMLAGMFYAWINLLFTRMFAIRSEQATTIKPMARYELWQLSSYFNIGAIVITVCIIALGLLRVNNATLYAYAGIFVIGLPLCVQGFSFLGFMGRTGCLLFRTKYMLIIAMLALFPLSLIILVILGTVEQIFRFRQKALNR
ncbi:MAG: hypothetical protein GX802_06365 [Clostridiales bacterium]|nr:hypothetical protein [Clostridiales bacterium]